MSRSPHLVAAAYPPPPAHRDPDFVRAADWISDGEASSAMAVAVGVPFTELSISGARCDLLPGALRASLWSFSTYLPGRGVDLSEHSVADLGDVDLEGLFATEAMKRIQDVVSSASEGLPMAIVGGDNSITAPSMLGSVGESGGLLTIDAHHDLRDYERDGMTNGSPVRVLMDAGVDGDRICQIGIRDLSNSRAYSDLANRSGIRVVPSEEVRTRGMASCVEHAIASLAQTEAIYVDLDLDVVDRSHAPGAPGSQPGGLMPADVLEAAFVCGTHPMVRVMDIVEVDPERDVGEVTVRLAAAALLHFFAGVARR